MTDPSRWFHMTIVETGRLPLFSMMIAFTVAFVFIRMSTRLIRAQVKWWPGNVTPGGLHIHHVMFGTVMVLIAGFALVATADFHTPVLNALLAALFGVGAALILDEFAMILHLRDVYWSDEGRLSIDAVCVAFAITVLFVLGVHPLGIDSTFDIDDGDDRRAMITGGTALAVQFALAAITMLKAKFWTGLLGLFFPILLIVGAVRLARPHSPWARRYYRSRPGKLRRAVRRETRVRGPLIRAKVRVMEFIAGRFDETSP